MFFFFNDTATAEIYTLSLHDALPIYLTLNRMTATLSGGESQRIRLATQIGSNLTGVLYVLDEPTIGLHQRDNIRLIRSEEHTLNSSHANISYAVFCLKKKK